MIAILDIIPVLYTTLHYNHVHAQIWKPYWDCAFQKGISANRYVIPNYFRVHNNGSVTSLPLLSPFYLRKPLYHTLSYTRKKKCVTFQRYKLIACGKRLDLINIRYIHIPLHIMSNAFCYLIHLMVLLQEENDRKIKWITEYIEIKTWVWFFYIKISLWRIIRYKMQLL